MKLLLFLFTSLIFYKDVVAMDNFITPESSPKISASTAVLIIEEIISGDRKKGDKYVDRIWLITLKDERVWILSVASPLYGFEFYKVDMKKKASLINDEEGKVLFPIIFGK